jgi:c-di-GMP-binding flagellar brake protein YcgR
MTAKNYTWLIVLVVLALILPAVSYGKPIEEEKSAAGHQQSSAIFAYDGWTSVSPLLVNDAGYAQTYNGKIYFVGSNAVQEYDPLHGNWTIRNSTGLGYHAYRGGSALIGDRIYIVHGWSEAFYYDIPENKFVSISRPNVERIDVAVAAVNGTLYVSGGWLSGDPTSLTTVEAYSPLNDTWWTVASMNIGRKDHEMIGVGGYLYAIGGVTGWGWSQFTNTVERYDPKTNQWTFVPSTANTYQEFGVTTIDDRLIVIASAVTELYDIANNTWLSGPSIPQSPFDYMANALAYYNGSLYSIGSRDPPGNYYKYVYRWDPAPPGEPQNLQAMPGNRRVTLTWNVPVSNGGISITDYRIYRNGTFHAQIGPSTSYTDYSVVNGIQYTYEVSAVNPMGEGPRSTEVIAIPASPPAPPQNLAATPGNRNVTLTWQPPVDNGGMPVTNYTIYYGNSPGNYKNNITVSNITNYTITGLTNGQRYYFAVSAINSAGEGQKSNETSAVPCTVPSAPRNLSATAGNANVTLSWEPPADDGGMAVTNYAIYYGTISGNYTMNITVGNISEYQITGLTNGQRYYFAVSAINAVGESEKSNEATALPCTIPSPPQDLTAVAGNSNVKLTWQPPADNGGLPVSGYIIYYGVSPGNYTTNITVDNVTTYTITSLTNGQRYYFAVSAINAVGESEKSNEASATPTAEQHMWTTLGFDVLACMFVFAATAIIAIWRRKRR